jgi:hypothetical protein
LGFDNVLHDKSLLTKRTSLNLLREPIFFLGETHLSTAVSSDFYSESAVNIGVSVKTGESNPRLITSGHKDAFTGFGETKKARRVCGAPADRAL